MRFEISKLGNRNVLKTYKNEWLTRAVFLKDSEIEQVMQNIQKNGWKITEV